jgi:hypothetical protein
MGFFFTGDRGFESGLLQRGVSNEPCGCRGRRTRVGPRVRIRFAPAVSLQTFGPSREELPFVQQPAAALYAPVQPDRSVGAVAVQRFRPAGLPSPTTERVDELRNQKRSDRGYGGVRKLFVDRQFSMRQQS